MTGDARCARVGVPGMPTMLVCQGRLVCMTGGRAAECMHVVRRVTLVAIRPARWIRMTRAGINGKRSRIVHVMERAEYGRGVPCRLCVTGGAGMAEGQGDVVRGRGRACKIGLMTLVAVGVHQLVISIDMAFGAGL